jgi:serine/threonine-protein kinase RsbT
MDGRIDGSAPHSYPVRDESDVFESRRAVRRLANQLGFPALAREELVIVVSELGSNILKYGVAGDLTFETVHSERHGIGIQVTARDIGPPFADFQMALEDGYSDSGPIDPIQLPRRRGFGGGLGAIARLSHSFEHLPGAGEKRIRVTRWLRPPR